MCIIYSGTLDNTFSFYIGSSDWRHEFFFTAHRKTHCSSLLPCCLAAFRWLFSPSVSLHPPFLQPALSLFPFLSELFPSCGARGPFPSRVADSGAPSPHG